MLGKRKWMSDAIKHSGSLHKTLHKKEIRDIPEAKLAKVEHSKDPLTREEIKSAETLKSFKK